MGKKQITDVTSKKAAQKAVSSVSTKLTPRQKKFSQALAKGLNQTQAAIAAGYRKASARYQGSKLAKNSNILQQRDKAAQKVQEKLDYKDAQHFIDLGRIGQIAEQKGDLATALKALVQQGKLCGLYVERVKADVSGSISSFSVNSFLEKFNAEK